MPQQLMRVAITVKDYDEAIAFYVEKLGFTLVEDTILSPEKRWVVVRPPGTENGCALLLAKAANDRQLASVGNQTGGRVFLFMFTDSFDQDYANLLRQGIKIERAPVVEPFGRVCVFADLYGNLWDLIEPIPA